MAKKKKKQANKQRVQRQQKRQKRRTARVRQRTAGLSQFGYRSRSRSADWGDTGAGLKNVGADLLDDLLPLFPHIHEAKNVDSGDTMYGFIKAALDTDDLAAEKELAHISFDPMEATATYVGIAEAQGHDPEQIERMPKVEREELIIDLMTETLRQITTDEMRQEVIDALTALRTRYREEGRQEPLARAAALQALMTMENEATEQIWWLSGLMVSMLRASVQTGFTMAEAASELEEEARKSSTSIVDLLSGKQPASGAMAKLTSLVNSLPGIQGFLDKQVDEIWDEGMHALFTSELRLGLYTLEELEKGAMIIATAYAKARDSSTDDVSDTPKKKRAKSQADRTLEKAIQEVSELVNDYFTPERLETLSTHLAQIVQEENDTHDKWLSFTMMLKQYADKDPEELLDSGALTHAYLGEMKPLLVRETD